MEINFEWPTLVKFLSVVLTLVGGVATVPLVNWLKGLLGWTGRKAQLLVAAVSVFIATSTLIVTGAISPVPMTTDYVISLFTLVLLASQAEYQRISKPPQLPGPPTGEG